MVLAGSEAKQVQWTNVYQDALVSLWLHFFPYLVIHFRTHVQNNIALVELA